MNRIPLLHDGGDVSLMEGFGGMSRQSNSLSSVKSVAAESIPMLTGVLTGSAAAFASRAIAPAGSLVSRHSGLVGGFLGFVILLAAHSIGKEYTSSTDYTPAVTSLATGAMLELFELVTRFKIENM